MSSPRAQATAARRDPPPVDPFVWRACAGKRVKIPAVGSRVYYFPEGHVEQSSSLPDFSAVPRTKPYVLCSVAYGEYRVDRNTDEVYAKMILDPRAPASLETSRDPALEAAEDGEAAVAFEKVLMPTNVNELSRFLVPKFCAESFFPDLDFDSEKPMQTLVMHDLLGNRWEFRHVYVGTERRHLLTRGWSKFVNAKRLVVGDSVIFIRNRDGEVFLGIRRRNMGAAALASNAAECEGFFKDGTGRVAAQAVVEAVRAAEVGDRAFEVEYYPGDAAAEFVVAEEEVAAAMRVAWVAGLKVWRRVVIEDAVTRVVWQEGTVERTVLEIEGPWPLSPWRMLEIAWENPQLYWTIKNVSPWQVQLQPSIGPPYLPTREPRTLLSVGSGLENAMMGRLPPSLSNCDASAAGMQGSRLEPNNSNQPLHSENISVSDSVQELTGACTERNPTSPLPYESSLPSSKEGLNDSGNPSKRAGKMPFQLFGQIVRTKQPHGIDVVAAQQQEEADGAVQSADPPSAQHTKATSPA